MTNYSEFFRAVWLEVQYQRLQMAGETGSRASFGRRFAWLKRVVF